MNHTTKIIISDDPARLGPDGTTDELMAYARRLEIELESEFDEDITG